MTTLGLEMLTKKASINCQLMVDWFFLVGLDFLPCSILEASQMAKIDPEKRVNVLGWQIANSGHSHTAQSFLNLITFGTVVSTCTKNCSDNGHNWQRD